METQYHLPQIEGSSKNKQKEHKRNLIKFWLKASAHEKHWGFDLLFLHYRGGFVDLWDIYCL